MARRVPFAIHLHLLERSQPFTTWPYAGKISTPCQPRGFLLRANPWFQASGASTRREFSSRKVIGQFLLPLFMDLCAFTGGSQGAEMLADTRKYKVFRYLETETESLWNFSSSCVISQTR